MLVLVTWGSKLGGTEGIARIIADTLEQQGFEVTAEPVEKVTGVKAFDAVIVGGALYANRWPGKLRRFVNRNIAQLRKVPVWFFSSGPLDDSAEKRDIPPPNQAAVLADRVGVKRHVTFGGRLEPDAKGFPAAAMAKKLSGDWRNPERIRDWATKLARELPTAAPGTYVEHAARSLIRLLGYGVLGWAAAAALAGAILPWGGFGAALAVHAIVLPIIFIFLAWRYFRVLGSRDPLPTAAIWTGLTAALDLSIAARFTEHGLQFLTSMLGAWLPLLVVFLATWFTGLLISTMPWPKPAESMGQEGPQSNGRRHAASAQSN